MGAPILVVSNPPHGACDAQRAAPHLGLTAAEVTLKAHYPVPEIWLALEGAARAEAAARELAAAGLRVTVVPGEAVRDVPPRAPIESFSFGEKGLAVTVDDLEEELAYDAPIIAVFCTPRDAGAAGSGAAVAHAPRGFLDIYVSRGGRRRRLAVVPGITNFSGLGGAALPSAAGNLMKFVTELEARFPPDQVDRRLALLQPRRRTTMTGMPAVTGSAATAPRRKGFSYGTEELRNLLASIAPDLGGIDEFELVSRLVYLTKR